MKFLAVSNNVGDPTPFLADERARTAQLRDSGVFERVLVKADWSGAVVLVSAVDMHEARAVIDSLPLVVNGVTAFELTPVIEVTAVEESVAAPPHTHG